MTISPLGSAPTNALYFTKTTSQSTTSDQSTRDDAVKVVLSSAARLSIKLDERVQERSTALLDTLPDDVFNTQTMIDRADTAVKALMRDLGIPSNTPVEIEVAADGSISAAMDHPGQAYFTEALNTDRDTSNALTGATNAVQIQAHAQVVEQARTSAQATPANADSVYAQALGMVDDMKQWGAEFAFSDGPVHVAHVKSDGTLIEAV